MGEYRKQRSSGGDILIMRMMLASWIRIAGISADPPLTAQVNSFRHGAWWRVCRVRFSSNLVIDIIGFHCALCSTRRTSLIRDMLQQSLITICLYLSQRVLLGLC